MRRLPTAAGFLLPESDDDVRLTEAIDAYWLSKELDLADSTIPGYRRTLGRFLGFVGDVEIAAVTSDDVRRFLLHLRSLGLGKRTVSDAWVPLSSLWTWAETELGVTHIIRGKVKRPPFTKKVVEPFTQEAMRKLLGAVWTDGQGAERKTALRDRAMVLTLLDSGVRVSELCALTTGDIDQEAGTLHIRHGKGDKARLVTVGRRTLEAIRRYLAETGEAAHSAPLFPSKATGEHLHRNAIKQLLTRLGKRAGVTGVHAHRFRHTFAINYLRNGGNAVMLQDLLGHTDMTMTRLYVHLAEQDFAGAREQSPADKWQL